MGQNAIIIHYDEFIQTVKTCVSFEKNIFSSYSMPK